MVRHILTATVRKIQKSSPWLLAFLVFLAATVPSIQLARQATSGSLTSFVIEICATRGQSANQKASLQIVDVTPELPVKHSSRTHCPLCIPPENTASLPPLAIELALVWIDYLERVRVLSDHEPQTPHQRSNVQSRAPPALV